MRPLMLPLLLGLAAACAAGPEPSDVSDGTDDTDTDADTGPWYPPDGGEITLQSGGAYLAGYYSPAPTEGAPAVILLTRSHPENVHRGYPDDMLQAMTDRGWTWIITDHRGTLGSTGEFEYHSPAHVFDLVNWSNKLAADGYPVQAIVDIYGPVGTAFANSAADRGAATPCAVTLAEGGLPEGLDFMRKTPAETRRLFQYAPRGQIGETNEAMRQYDPGDWVFKPTPVIRYDKTAYWYEAQYITDMLAFHDETFPNCLERASAE